MNISNDKNVKKDTGHEKYIELFKNMVIFGFGLIGAKLVQFMLLPYFTNVLSAAEYGTIDLTITFVGLFVPIVTIEVSDSVLRFGLSEKTNKVDLFHNMVVILLFGIILTLVLSPLLYFYKTLWPYRCYVVLLIIGQSIRTNFALFVKSDNRVMVYSIDSIITALLIAGFDIIFISILKKGIEGYFLAEIIGDFASCVFLYVAGRLFKYFRIKKAVNKQLFSEMIKYSFPLLFNAISWWITSFSDRAVLNIFFSESEVGIYSVAAKIPAIVTTLLSVFTQAWIMSAVKNFERDKDPKFFERVYMIYTLVLYGSVSFIILIIKPMMKIYVGKEFFESWYYVPILLMGSAYLGVSNYYGAIYAAAKANLLEIKSTIVCALCNLFFNFILIPRWGILGAVLATMMSYLIVDIVRIVDTKKIINIKTWNYDFFISGIILSLLVIGEMRGNTVFAIIMFLGLVSWKGIRLKYENNNM